MKAKPFEAGKPLLDQITATKLNALVAAINENEVQTGVGVLVTRGPGGTTLTVRQQRQPPPYIHPFKIFHAYEKNGSADQHRLRVQIGRVTVQRWVADGTDPPIYSAEDVLVAYENSSGDMMGDDFGPTGDLGHYDLTATTSYGVWLLVASTYHDRISPLTTQFPTIRDFHGTTATVFPSSTYTNYTDAEAFCKTLSGNDRALYYLGRVETDSDGGATVKQWRKSDVCMGNDSLPKDIDIGA